MLTKILFTIAVILVVAVVFRHQGSTRRKLEPEPDPGPEGALSARTISYIVIGILVALSVLLYALNWFDDNRIITIHVTGGDGVEQRYNARKKNLEGRSFITLDGRTVTLGDADRMEITETE